MFGEKLPWYFCDGFDREGTAEGPAEDFASGLQESDLVPERPRTIVSRTRGFDRGTRSYPVAPTRTARRRSVRHRSTGWKRLLKHEIFIRREYDPSGTRNGLPLLVSLQKVRYAKRKLSLRYVDLTMGARE